MLSRRALLLGPLALAACAVAPPLPDDPRPVTLASAFRGRTSGRGVFRNRITGAERRFSADLTGRLSGDRLTVREVFSYDDGQTDTLTWVFTRTGPQTWEGTREDTVGKALVVEDGRLIRLAYEADFRTPEGTTRLGFADIIWKRADGVVVSDGIVTRLGLPVGAVRFEIRR
jgi:hypothetical protein